MQGLGNDFVVIDAVTQSVTLNAVQIRRLADRHFGVGCDQVLLVEPPPDATVDFRYRIFNADGGEVAQCGNGARCFARFVRAKGLIDRDRIRVVTAAGRMDLELVEANQVRVEMGVPRFAPEALPLAVHGEMSEYQVEIDGVDRRFGAVSMGNPHAVITVPDVAAAPVNEVGSELASHRLFPERVNVGFMQIVDSRHIRLRVFERGVGETLACGSGACAAAVVGIEQGRLRSPVTVALPGGELKIEWSGRGAPVVMTGPAECVFEGEIDL
ncbi:diaminopimelate epimerase [Methylohalobius crimeensis]|uniref:diaminopimelate epimerase n=1 Tax=Methylohalobius crimeensis TaxID=244365 RepID=UPI002AA2AEBC|nr:diaminopimelate epimerase [Methylohalobius crimeensis]